MSRNTLHANLGAPILGTILAPGVAFSITGTISATYAVDPPVLFITVTVDSVALPVSIRHLPTANRGQLVMAFDATGTAPSTGSTRVEVSVTDEDSNGASDSRVVAVQAGHPGPVVPPPAFFIDIASSVGLRGRAFPDDAALDTFIAEIQGNPALLRLSSLFSAAGGVLVGPSIVTDPPSGGRPLPPNTEITRLGFWLLSEAFPVVSGSESSLPSLTKVQSTDGFDKVPLPTFSRSMIVEFRVHIEMYLLSALIDALLPTLRARAHRLGLDLKSLTISALPKASGSGIVTSFSAGLGWPSADVAGTITEMIGTVPIPLVGSPCLGIGTPSMTLSVPTVTGSSYSVNMNSLDQVFASFFVPFLFLEPILLGSTIPSQVGQATGQLTSIATSLLAAIPSITPVQVSGLGCPFPAIPLTWSSFGLSGNAISGAGGINAADIVNRTQASVSMSLAGPTHITAFASDLAGGTEAAFTVALSGLAPDGPAVWTVQSDLEVVDSGVVDMSNGMARFTTSLPLPTDLKAGSFSFGVAVAATETSKSAPPMTLSARASQQVMITALRDPKFHV